MQTAIVVIWAIGLIGALVPTAIILKQVVVMLRVLRNIHELAVMIRDASAGIRANVAAGSKLAGLAEPLTVLHRASMDLSSTARVFGRRIEAL